MISRRTVDRINNILNETQIRRSLVKYFMDRGFVENFDMPVFPPSLQDLTATIPEIANRVEIVPHAIELDPQTGYGRIGWNMFVDGNQRLFLGETEYANMHDFAKQLEEGKGFNIIPSTSMESYHETTPRRITSFLTRILTGKGHVRHVIPDHAPIGSPGAKGSTLSGTDMFNQNRAARPER